MCINMFLLLSELLKVLDVLFFTKSMVIHLVFLDFGHPFLIFFVLHLVMLLES